MRVVMILVFWFSLLFAKADYSQMSNEELIALIGYVSFENQKEFDKELEKRKPSFTTGESQKYQEALEKKQKEEEKKDDNSTA